jgi:hypothetical protein
MSLILKALDLLLVIVPFLVEMWKKSREKDETPLGYVRRQQEERLKTYDAILSGGEDVTRLSRARIALSRELLLRMRSARTAKTGSVQSEGAEVPKP